MAFTMSADRLPERELQLGWLDVLNRLRPWLFALVGLVYVASFNGLWRVGVDSALYRGLARSIVRGDGYVFAGEHHRHAFPGMPLVLAACEKLFGTTPVAPLILITLMALATLWLVDRTIALRYPLWVATIVTLAMGMNFRFVRQSQQLMTDVPFALGVAAALYALERLRLSEKGQWKLLTRWAALLLAGLAFAAATRPTFGVLAGAIVVGSGFRAVLGRDGRRGLNLAIVVAAIAVLLALFLSDPRTVGFAPMQGVYEQELVERVQDLSSTILGQLDAFLGRNLNDAFYSQRMQPMSVPAALVVLVSSLFVLRRNVVWGLMIFGLVAITLPLSTVPRYYLMVMPQLWLGWVLMFAWIAMRIPERFRGPMMGLVLLLPIGLNFGRDIGFIQEQRAPDIAWLHGKDREASFYAKYRGGTVVKMQHVADMIARHATKAQKIIGPEAHVLAYYADRSVIGERTLFVDRDRAITQLPNLLAKAAPDMAIFPLSAYGDQDPSMRELIRRRILTARREIDQVDGIRLAFAQVNIPPAGANWRTYRAPAPTTSSAATKPTRSLTAKEKSALLAKRQIKAERELKVRRLEKQTKLDRRAKLDHRAKLEKQEKRDRALKREKLERRERIERRRRLESVAAKRATTRPTSTTSTTPQAK